eukprot:TRINITY_DN2417_c0_g1_i1.p1 TRINITY_DN2417_c0_g1~~TRINITY_DN2417_c0_g1_i1.p1  ORF type:complete len:446 (-),score=129.83 TRINITY_DN2417_c0_g1_i1:26-1363(-)
MDSDQNKKVIGNYVLGKTIGEGKFGKVKYAFNKMNAKSYAIKLLDKKRLLKDQMMDKIKREIKIMQSLKHPNIIEMKEVFVNSESIYLVMDLAEGGEIFAKLAEEGKFTEEKARKYFQQLIMGVDYCHSQNVIHRDIKPENLLLDAKGNLKIADFGMAALVPDINQSDLLKTKCGTTNYAAPEVLLENSGYGAPADLWSCGVVLFVFCSGILPFQCENEIDLVSKILKADFSFCSWFSENLKDLLNRIIYPDPLNRITIDGIKVHPWFKIGFSMKERKITLQDNDSVMFQTFSKLPEVTVTQERTSVSSSTQTKKISFTNVFEFITMSGAFDISKMLEDASHLTNNYCLSSTVEPEELFTKLIEVLKDKCGEKNIFVNENNYKIKIKKKKVTFMVRLYEITPKLHYLDFNKRSGSFLDFDRIYGIIEEECFQKKLIPILKRTNSK